MRYPRLARWLTGFSLLLISTFSAAELKLQGMAMQQHLGVNDSLVAYYLDTQPNGDSVQQKIVIKLLNNRWSPRKWQKYWQENIQINNQVSGEQGLADELNFFIQLPQNHLKQNDEIEFSQTSQGMAISINHVPVVRSDDRELFIVLMNVFSGPFPPSRSFKEQLIGRKPYQSDLTAYLANAFEQDRKQQVKDWLRQVEEDKQAVLALQQQEADRLRKKAKQRVKKKNAQQHKFAQQQQVEQQQMAAQSYWKQYYYWRLLNHVNSEVNYPASAVKNQQQGEIKIAITIDRRGTLRRNKNLTEDVADILVEEVKSRIGEAVKQVDKPEELTARAISFTVPYTFILDQGKPASFPLALQEPVKPNFLQ